MRVLIQLISLFISTTLLHVTAYGANSKKEEKFAIYYSDKEPVRSFENYDLLILDSRYHPPIQELSQKVPVILGYISLGEIPQTSPYFSLFMKNNILLKENENWKGSYGIDIREALWHKTVIESIIPGILRSGFDGIFIDTLDTPLENERVDPKRYNGTSKSAIRLIQAIRLHYPTIRIMVNRAYSILPQLAPYINMALGESVRHTYNFDKKIYEEVTEDDYLLQVKLLKNARANNKDLKIYTLDYSDKNEKTKIADIYRVQRANGFIPYVTTIKLNELVEEPVAVQAVKPLIYGSAE